VDLGENVQMQLYENEQIEGVYQNICTITNVDENVLIDTEENMNKEQYLHQDQNHSIQSTCTEIESICMVYINDHKPTGAHICDLCKKAVHIINRCSYSILVEKKGFGEKRICHQSNIKSSNHTRTDELSLEENWRGETEKNKMRSNYLQKDPTILFYNDSSKTKSPIIGILKNWKPFKL